MRIKLGALERDIEDDILAGLLNRRTSTVIIAREDLVPK